MAKSYYSPPLWHERRKQALNLREKLGLSYTDIGKQMGITSQRAWALYKFAAAERDGKRAERKSKQTRRSTPATAERPW